MQLKQTKLEMCYYYIYAYKNCYSISGTNRKVQAIVDTACLVWQTNRKRRNEIYYVH